MANVIYFSHIYLIRTGIGNWELGVGSWELGVSRQVGFFFFFFLQMYKIKSFIYDNMQRQTSQTLQQQGTKIHHTEQEV